jgi:hypothetical protein
MRDADQNQVAETIVTGRIAERHDLTTDMKVIGGIHDLMTDMEAIGGIHDLTTDMKAIGGIHDLTIAMEAIGGIQDLTGEGRIEDIKSGIGCSI